MTPHNITNYIENRLATKGEYILKSEIPAEQIAIFFDCLFFKWQKEIAECAKAVREVLKEAGKKYFVVASGSTFLMEDMRHILESGLGKMAGHAFIYRERWSWSEKNVLECKGAAVVFEII